MSTIDDPNYQTSDDDDEDKEDEDEEDENEANEVEIKHISARNRPVLKWANDHNGRTNITMKLAEGTSNNVCLG